MRVLLFLNELSCASEVNESTADSGMEDFVDLLRHVVGKRQGAALVTTSPLKELELASGYQVAQWIAKRPGNRDKWRVIQSARNRAPSTVRDDSTLAVDYKHHDRPAEGLGQAHARDGLAISLPVEDDWRRSWVTVRRLRPVEDDAGTVRLAEDDVAVRHGWHRARIDEHADWISCSGLSGLAEGSDIWNARADFFPHLYFLPRVARDLRGLSLQWLQPVAEVLRNLNLATAEWSPARERTPHWRSKITPESASRKHLCEFPDTAGTSRSYELHARFTPGHGRIHFRLLPQERALEVGYIGRKLGIG